ncbi:MAG TPA: hypothetical protein VGL71_07575 [Urbifossiella sp.]|jgi:hypothetical protein
MHEFVVALRNGLRFTVKAHRVLVAEGYLALIDDGAAGSPIGDPFAGAVGLFAKGEVALVFSKGHLLSEEKGDPIDANYVSAQSDIPF